MISEQALRTSAGSRALPLTITSALTLLMIVIWCMNHRYLGFSRDAQIYAMQALAKLEPHLAGDLFFQNTSQDQFTVFSSVYAAFMRVFGLIDSAFILMVICTAWFYCAGWALARNLLNREIAWIAILMPIMTTGSYGAFKVFHYAEDFLTARLPAEAMVVSALALFAGGRRPVALAVSIAALFVHPLIALPGLLLIVGMWLPLRLTLLAAGAGTVLMLALAALATINPTLGHLLKVMDPEWSSILYERSEFLYPQFWPASDWLLNTRGLMCLCASAILFQDVRVRKMCIVALIVAAAGMALALIGSMIGPIGILMQGQAWRWVWIGTFLGVLLLLPTAYGMWQDKRCGPLCAMLLVIAWAFSPIDGTGAAALALILWLMRNRIDARQARLLHWAAIALGTVITGWIVANIWNSSMSHFDTGRESRFVQWVRDVGGLEVSIVVVAFIIWRTLLASRDLWLPSIASIALLATVIGLAPATFIEFDKFAYNKQDVTFSDWTSRIPPTSTVLVLRNDDTGTFAWLALHRQNYSAMDQSAGLVFSRETSMEVKRRSEVLQPVKDPDWKVHTNNIRRAIWRRDHPGKNPPSEIRPLTAEALVGLCRDPLLGFVVAKENVGFGAITHNRKGGWLNWNLYDCSTVRGGGNPA